MRATTVLRDIREKRLKQLKNEMFLPSGGLTAEQYKQLLIVDPPFNLDIVSLMHTWSEKRMKLNEKENTLFLNVKDDWIKAGKDSEEQKNRRNGIQSLINHGVLLTSFESGQEMTICQFMQRNSQNQIKNLLLQIGNQRNQTKKTYQVMYGSFSRFAMKFIHGPSPRLKKRLKPLKRGIRPLELFEAAMIFDALEQKALMSTIAMRDLLIIRLLMYAGEGIEIKNILALKREDVNFYENLVSIKYRRGGRSLQEKKMVKCSSDFMKLLKSYLGGRKQNLFGDNKNNPVVQDHINKRLLRVLKKHEITDITLKSIQRSLINILLRNGLT